MANMAWVALTMAAAARKRQLAHCNANWSSYAAARGMRFTPGGSPSTGTLPRLDAIAESVPLTFVFSESETRFMCVPVAPLPGRVELSHRTVLSDFAHFLGSRDLLLGDRHFDDAFVVKTTNEETARLLLGESVRSDLLAFRAHSFSYDDGVEVGRPASARFMVKGLVVTPSKLDAAFLLLTELGNLRATIGAYR